MPDTSPATTRSATSLRSRVRRSARWSVLALGSLAVVLVLLGLADLRVLEPRLVRSIDAIRLAGA